MERNNPGHIVDGFEIDGKSVNMSVTPFYPLDSSELRIFNRLESFVAHDVCDQSEVRGDKNTPVSLDDKAREYVDYVFGADITNELSLTSNDADSIVAAFLEASDGMDDRLNEAQTIEDALKLMLLGKSHSETGAELGMTYAQIRERLKNYRFRAVRMSTKKGISQDQRGEILRAHVLNGRPKNEEENLPEALDTYTLGGHFSPRMQAFLADLLPNGFSFDNEQSNESDGIAVIEALSDAINPADDVRYDVSKFKALLFRITSGYSNPEIAKMEGVTLEAVESSIKRIKSRLRQASSDDMTGLHNRIVSYVGDYRTDENIVESVKLSNLGIYDMPVQPAHRNEREPDQDRKRQSRRKRQLAAMQEAGIAIPKQIRKSKPIELHVETETPEAPTPTVMPAAKQEINAPSVRPSDERKVYPVDDVCPEFTTLWGVSTLSNLYDAFNEREGAENWATVIMMRADGRDKTRKPDPEVMRAFRHLRRMAGNSKTSFGDNDLKKKAFDELTSLGDDGYKTLGDICREFKSVDPSMTDKDVASAVIESVADVLKDSKAVLVVRG